MMTLRQFAAKPKSIPTATTWYLTDLSEALGISSQQWHEGNHDPWPYINYFLWILLDAYKEFEERVGQVSSPKGAKTELVMKAIYAQVGKFRLVDIENACPGVSRDWIRQLLGELRKEGKVKCEGKGPAARWAVVQK